MRRLYHSVQTDPTVNLALEELLVSRCHPGDEMLFLWQNKNTVVIGRNQNPWKECNLEYLKMAGGSLVRRKSGGGAVYHDMGNLNFTFVSKEDTEAVSRNLAFILEGLAGVGIKAVFHGRNDLLVDGAKISGNAYYTEEGILCHHGTLLVDVDFEKLGKMLTVSERKLRSNGVDSVRSRVANLSSFNPDLSVDGLITLLSSRYLNRKDWQGEVTILSELPDEHRPIIEKYRSWAWNFGESPGFGIEMELAFSWGGMNLELSVTDGVVDDARVFTDALDVNRADSTRHILIGTPYSEWEIRERIVGLYGD